MFHKMLSLFVCLILLFGTTAAMAQESPDGAPLEAVQTDQEMTGGVMFIENVGQFGDTGALFQVMGGNGALWLAEDALWITLVEKPALENSNPTTFESSTVESTPRKGVNIKLSFPGANPHPILEPFNRLETHVSYFQGNDPANWYSDVPVWGGVRYKDLYPGVDLEVAAENGQVIQKLACRANCQFALQEVWLQVEGAESASSDGEALRLTTSVGEFSLPMLRLEGAVPKGLPSTSEVQAGVLEVTQPFAPPFLSPRTDFRDRPPSVLAYSTYLGSDSSGNDIAVDSQMAAYVTGGTFSPNFPTTPGVFDPIGGIDAFVAKLDPTGSTLVYATYLGGPHDECEYERGNGIAVDQNGMAYVTGMTACDDFPITPGTYDETFNGRSHYGGDVFVTKFNGIGTDLVYSTFLGGTGDEESYGIVVDRGGSAYITGVTNSTNFPITPAAFDSKIDYRDGFVTKLNPDGSALVYSTFLGGNSDESVYGITLDGKGSAYVTGYTLSLDFPTTPGAPGPLLLGEGDAFVAKVNRLGSNLVYATLLGGSNWDNGNGIAVDRKGAAYITGQTQSPNFPTTPNAFDTSFNSSLEPYSYDTFVVKMAPSGLAFSYATFLGGASSDTGSDIAVDRRGIAYVTGITNSSDFPITPGAYDVNLDGAEIFISILSQDGSSQPYATFIGGSESTGESSSGIAIGRHSAVYISGYTHSPDFPTTPDAFDPTYNESWGPNANAFVASLLISPDRPPVRSDSPIRAIDETKLYLPFIGN